MSKSRDIADSAATINYIDGLTSDAQGQLDDKATLDGSPTFTGTVTATAFSGDGSSLTGVDSLPSQTGNNGLFLTTDGSTASWAAAGAGFTIIDEDVGGVRNFTITGIPSGVKQIFIGFDKVKAGGGDVELRIGSGSIDNTNTYSGMSFRIDSSNNFSNADWGDSIRLRGLNGEHSGTAILSLVDETNNIWGFNCQTANSKYTTGSKELQFAAGGKAISGAIDRILIRGASGDLGSNSKISIAYL